MSSIMTTLIGKKILFPEIPDETIDVLTDIHYRVTSQLLCPQSNKILDSKEAVLLRVKWKGRESSVVVHESVFQQAAAKIEKTLVGAEIEIFHARILWAEVDAIVKEA